MNERKSYNVDDMLKESNEAVEKLTNIFNEVSKKDEFKSEKKLANLKMKLKTIKEKKD